MIELLITTFIVIISLYGYIVYGLETKRKVLRPRATTWLIWAILGTCVSFLQVKHGAGLGAVVTVVAAASNYILAAMAWYYGHRNIHPIDILSVLAATGVLVLWVTASDAVTVVFATLTYLFGFIPTFERAFRKPFDENVTPFVVNILKYTLALFVTDSLNLETALYPLVLTIFNLVFMAMVLSRRSTGKLPKKPLAKKRTKRYT